MKHHFHSLERCCHVMRSQDVHEDPLISVTWENQCSVRINKCNIKNTVFLVHVVQQVELETD